MYTIKNNISELDFDEYSEGTLEQTIFKDPINPESAEELIVGIKRAIELDERSMFLEGLCERLGQLGVECTVDDTDIMLTEVKRRYKEILGITCPRTVQEWVKKINTPGTTKRKNHYELCYALEMNFEQTEDFFCKHYLTLPFNVKDEIDAVFMYALYHKKTYSVVEAMLSEIEAKLSDPKNHSKQKNAYTSTTQIKSTIFDIEDNEKFLRYLSEHCYDEKQQFKYAKKLINEEIEMVKEHIKNDPEEDIISTDRLNSLTIKALLGYRYQSIKKEEATNPLPKLYELPKRFEKSLPNDVTIGKIINDKKVSYEELRKTLMLLKFFNFYTDAEDTDRKEGKVINKSEVNSRLMDFYMELDNSLIICGFSPLYLRHPFDCLLLYCANSFAPIQAMHYLNERDDGNCFL